MNRTWKPSSRWRQLKHFLKKIHPEPWGNNDSQFDGSHIFQMGWFNQQLSHETTIVGSPGSDPDQRIQTNYTPWKLTWQWKIDLFEDVFPIEHGDFPMLCWFSGVYVRQCSWTSVLQLWCWQKSEWAFRHVRHVHPCLRNAKQRFV